MNLNVKNAAIFLNIYVFELTTKIKLSAHPAETKKLNQCFLCFLLKDLILTARLQVDSLDQNNYRSLWIKGLSYFNSFFTRTAPETFNNLRRWAKAG
jgi:hypothetical protein